MSPILSLYVDAPTNEGDGRASKEELELPDLHLQQEEGSEQMNTKELKVETLESSDAMAVLFPVDLEAIETVVSPEIIPTQNEHDKVVNVAEKMNAANVSLSADMQAPIQELQKPTELPDTESNCCLECNILSIESVTNNIFSCL